MLSSLASSLSGGGTTLLLVLGLLEAGHKACCVLGAI